MSNIYNRFLGWALPTKIGTVGAIITMLCSIVVLKDCMFDEGAKKGDIEEVIDAVSKLTGRLDSLVVSTDLESVDPSVTATGPSLDLKFGFSKQIPPRNSVVSSSLPTLVVSHSLNSGNSYLRFVIANDSGFSDVLLTSPRVKPGSEGSTAWTVDTKLDSGKTYYWRAVLNDSIISNTYEFEVRPTPHVAPSPFIAQEHAYVTFYDVPPESEIVILTVEGKTVIRLPILKEGLLNWNVRFSDGELVPSGIYLWYVDGTNIKGKFAVLREQN